MNSLPKDILRCFLSVCNAKSILAFTLTTTFYSQTILEPRYQHKIRVHLRKTVAIHTYSNVTGKGCDDFDYVSYAPSGQKDGFEREHIARLPYRITSYRNGKKHGYRITYAIGWFVEYRVYELRSIDYYENGFCLKENCIKQFLTTDG